MSSAASFSERWARDNLVREATPHELKILSLFSTTCSGDEAEAAGRARGYYTARGRGGTELWHKWRPDDEDILSSCQDVCIVPLKARTVSGRRMTIVRLPAPMALDRPLSAKALLARWLMMLDIRLRDDPTPGDEVVIIDVCDLQPSHLKNHFKGNYWKDFISCMKYANPLRFSEIHIINTDRLKTVSLLLLHIGMYPWRRKLVHFHSGAGLIEAMDYPLEGLPHEYGGKSGAMKDLSDEWTKKLLSNSKWLQSEERMFYNTDLKPETRSKTQHRVKRSLKTYGSYDMITRTHSCKSLNRDDLDDGLYGAYRTFKISADTF